MDKVKKTMSNLWIEVCNNLKSEMHPSNYDMWIAGLQAQESSEKDQTTLHLYTRNRFAHDHIIDHYATLIEQYVHAIDQSINVVIELGQPTTLVESEPKQRKNPSNKNNKKTNQRTGQSQNRQSPLQEDFTFDTFVVGPNNQFAYSVAQNITEKPSKDNNPFYVYGGTGLGKTHLIQAIGNTILANHSHKKIAYVSASELTTRVIQSFRQEKSAHDYKNILSSVDLLLLDDIQNIKGPSVINVFFEVFNELYNAGKQIIITSDVRPLDIDNLDERIRSRFNGGLIVEIQPPELETRFNILKSKIDIKRQQDPKAPICSASDSLLFHLAEIVASNVRDLEGALKLLNAKAEIQNEKITKAFIDDVASEHIAVARRTLNGTDILKYVANYYNISESDIRSKRRLRSLVEPRQVVMYLCRELTELSLPDIGKILVRDHTTILHGARKVEEKLKEDTMFRSRIDAMRRSLAR